MTKALPLVAYTDLASQVEALEKDGYVYYPSTINADEVAKLKATMDRLEAINENFDRHDEPQNSRGFLNKIINNSFNRDPIFMQCHCFPEASIPLGSGIFIYGLVRIIGLIFAN